MNLLRKKYFFYFIVLLIIFVLVSKIAKDYVAGAIDENNPFYGISTAQIHSTATSTDDNLINIQLDYAPNLVERNSPEFFIVTLTYYGTNQIVKHADSDIIITKDGQELYKALVEFSRHSVHTNG